MKIAIFGRVFNPGFKPYIIEFFNNVALHKIEVLIYESFYKYVSKEIDLTSFKPEAFSSIDEVPDDIDFLVSIGGDGTFLESIAYLKNHDIPMVGINSGRLGFLANISKEEISKAFAAIINKDYKLEERSLISIASGVANSDYIDYALNEITVQKEDSIMIAVDAYINNEFLNSYWTDGLIVATPTGSTAYSLSVGGPIVLPRSGNFIMAPIASHNLTVRPIVVPDNVVIKLKVKSRSGRFLVTADNRRIEFNDCNNQFILKKADFTIKMLQFPFNNYYSTLRSKLMWGVDKRN